MDANARSTAVGAATSGSRAARDRSERPVALHRAPGAARAEARHRTRPGRSARRRETRSADRELNSTSEEPEVGIWVLGFGLWDLMRRPSSMFPRTIRGRPPYRSAPRACWDRDR